MIDILAFMRTLVPDQKEKLCGIRHKNVYENLDNLLKKLSQIAELVFCQGLYSVIFHIQFIRFNIFLSRWSRFECQFSGVG